MATVLRIKRSSAGSTTVPSSLKPSELAYAEGTSTYSDVSGGNIVSHGKMYYGRGVDTNGNATTVDIIGGKYFTDMLDHQHGTLTTNSAIVVDSDSKINVLNVDNITLDGNTFSSTDANGNLNFDTNGTGTYIFSGAATHDTNFFKINDGSTDRFVVDSFSGALDITTPSLSNADTVLNIDSTWNNDVVFKGIAFNVTDTDSNDASRLLELSVGGAKKFDVDKSGNVSLTGNVTFDNQTTFGIQDNTAAAFLIKEGSNSYFNITTTDSSELITFGTADVTIDNDLSVNGGDIKTTQTSFDLINTSATTVNFAGAATAINMGSANTTLDLGNIRIFGNTISTDSSSATELIIDPFPDAGDAGGDVIIRGNLQVAGTTTTVNSTEMSVNDPVFTIGDSVTEKTVLTIAASGATDIIIDNPSGVVESATITGTGIGSGRTISNVKIAFNVGGSLSTTPIVGDDIYFYDGTSFSLLGTYDSESTGELVINLASNISTRGDDFYNGNQLTTDSSGTPSNTASITKVDTKVFKTTTITLSDVTTSSIAAETKLTISQASDDNLDRGIQFKYLKTNASKVGFFGYDDDTEYFTFIPDASNNSNLFSGTKGEAWFKTVKLDDGINLGVPYFNSNLELTRTVAGNTAASFFKIDSGEVDGSGNPIMVGSSNAFLTVDASGVPIWSNTLDGGSF
tara:strand:+ start:29540 stop:31591 length:2052 start_codon:yes stop_codon:yes gene_type:complete